MRIEFTDHFVNEILEKRPHLRRDWLECVVLQPLKVERLRGGKYRMWGRIPTRRKCFLQVITLSDMRTVNNAFIDLDFSWEEPK